MSSAKPNGVILYEGPSLLDGAPIVVIATGIASGSTNRKTGAMVQTYILRSNVEPTAAVASGGDKSICGDCRHRGTRGKQRTCYVNVGQGPLGVYRAYRRGRYPVAGHYANLLWLPERKNGDSCIGKDVIVRLGTYGDPAAVPVRIWESLTRHCKGHTGYTHQWRTAHSLKGLCMASVDTPEEALLAQWLGWRTFRVAMPTDLAKLPIESRCPASAEMGKKLVCSTCLACDGATGKRGSIVIQAHGGFAVMSNVRKIAGIPIRVE
jgi:hypothetical protein